jgi:aminoglycoside phosphotransferase (APT) family kinase protein
VGYGPAQPTEPPVSEAPPIHKRSSRDPGELRERLGRWLRTRLEAPEIESLSSPSASGMSSETLVFEVRFRESGAERTGAFVARLAPDPRDIPVFPLYDLEAQFRVMRLVAERSRVAVPRVRWLELDPSHLGSPFFVMERAPGRVPPDIMPYNMGSWLSEASPADQRSLQDATVAAIAGLHAIDLREVDTGFLEFPVPGATALARHIENQRRYYAWMRDGRRHPVLERCFAWLDANPPREEGPPVISWGDSRIGNVLYEDFLPAAILDWEMAGLGPRGLDVGWLVFMHQFFEGVARMMGQPGMPGFLRREDVAAHYERVSGHALPDLAFYELYAALRHGIVMARIHARRVHFGEVEWPEDVDSVIPHRETLERMLEGSYWRG